MSIFKKTFFVSLFIFFVSLLFWGVYLLSFKKNTPGSETEKNIISEILPIKEETKISLLSDEAILSPTITAEGNAIKYYSRQTGKVYQLDFDGKNKKTLSDKELIGLVDVTWSPDKTKAITKFTRPNNEVEFFSFDYATQRGTSLKKGVDQIAWNTNSNKIFYKYYDSQTKKRSLNIADPDGSNWGKLADIDYRNISIAPIPKTGAVSFWNSPDSYTETIFESIPLIGGERKTIFKGKFGADYLWSPDGSYVVLSHSESRSGNKIQLGLINFNGGEYKNLGLPTFVSKCTWSSDNVTLYCAMPGGITESAILPNEYLEKKFNTVDTFWKINIKNGEKSRLVDPDKIPDKFDATNLFLNKDESMLFFVNRVDGKLYKINL